MSQNFMSLYCRSKVIICYLHKIFHIKLDTFETQYVWLGKIRDSVLIGIFSIVAAKYKLLLYL